MATSATMQLALVNPVSCLTNRSRFSNGVSLLRLQRNVTMKVKCKSEDGKKDEAVPSTTPTPYPDATPIAPHQPKKVLIRVGPTLTVGVIVQEKTGFFDILAFSGPGPERINGRLAMIGFVAALAAELSTGEDVITQIANGGVSWFLGTSVLLTLASLIPMFKGVTAQSKSDGIMTSEAELLNGRFAMLGLVSLALSEYVKGSALV